MSAKQFKSTDMALVFHNVSIATLVPPTPILSNVSGFVKRGGITAVFGASASGKSLLLQSLAGRIQNLSITGDVYLNGVSIDPTATDNATAYVSQTTMLLGDLTPREMIRNAAAMKRKASKQSTEKHVNKIIDDFGLDHVADNYIGTIFRAGLSGGQKRRVDVAAELVTAPSVAFLDEPTSGLDGSIAFDVLNAIKKSISGSRDLAVMLTIHQPNSRILGLFDHILVLGAGGMPFFGTVQESIIHFTRIGHPPPPQYTPTDYYLKATDQNFTQSKYDFLGAFNSSEQYFDLMDLIECVQRRGQIEQLMKDMMVLERANSAVAVAPCQQGTGAAGDEESAVPLIEGGGGESPHTSGHLVGDAPIHPSDAPAAATAAGQPSSKSGRSEADDEVVKPEQVLAKSSGGRKTPASFLTRVWVLMYRDFTLAARDPTLYYLQCVLTLMFGFLIGACFFDLHYDIDETINYIPAAILWIILMCMYIPVFKVYHLMKSNERFEYEHTNNTYTVLVAWVAELLTVAILTVIYFPGTAVAYFMVGLPGRGFPFCMLLFWLSALTSESMLGFITKFFQDISAAVVTSQLALVLLTAFGAGLFIRWDDTPAYWEWLQALSIFNHSSRSAMIAIMRKLTYDCDLALDLNCYGPSGDLYTCEPGSQNGAFTTCEVNGQEVLAVSQGIHPDESYWRTFGYLFALFAGFRLGSLFFMYYPFQKVVFAVQRWWYSPYILEALVKSKLQIMKLEERVLRLVKQANVPNWEGESNNVRRCAVEEDPKNYCAGRSGSGGGGGSPGEASPNSAGESKTDDARAVEQIGGPGSESALRLSWTNLDLVLKKGGKKLIDNVSGAIEAGRVLALMGPSGAGKTTLLNALANRAPYAVVTGQVRFGGLPLTSRDLMYVPQFDEIKGYTTVVEQIQLVGRMKCRDEAGMKQRLVKLLQILGLFEKANVLCKELSGGELKRLSVGMGMISNPKVIFLDEPTTGLDSTAAFYLVQFLVNLARDMHVPAIMTIHQPAAMVFDMLQDLYLLESGRLAYFGPISRAAAYFSDLGHICPPEINPADFYLDLIYKPPASEDVSRASDSLVARNTTSKGSDFDEAELKEWRGIYRTSVLGAEVARKLQAQDEYETSHEMKAPDYDEPNSLARFVFLTSFFLRYFLVNPGYYVYRTCYLVMCAVYIGTLYLDLKTDTDQLIEYSGSVFFSIWATLFAAIGSTGLIAADRRQSFEQIKNGIMTPALFCSAQFVASLPYNAIGAVIFQSIFQWVTRVNPSGETFIYAILITWGHLTMMEAIMNIVVEVVKDAMLSVTLAMLVLGALFLLPGFFIQVPDMPVWFSWMSYIMPTKYTFDGYLHMIFHNQDFDTPLGTEYSGKDILDDLYNNTISTSTAWGMIGVLLAYIVVFRLAHYCLFLYASWPFLSSSTPPSSTATTTTTVK